MGAWEHILGLYFKNDDLGHNTRSEACGLGVIYKIEWTRGALLYVGPCAGLVTTPWARLLKRPKSIILTRWWTFEAIFWV